MQYRLSDIKSRCQTFGKNLASLITCGKRWQKLAMIINNNFTLDWLEVQLEIGNR